MANNITQPFKRLNDDPLDQDSLQVDFFGQDLTPGDENELIINSPQLYVGFPFFNQKDGELYYVSGISGDGLRWLTTIFAPSSFANRVVLLKFTEAGSRVYYNGEMLLIGDDLVDMMVTDTYEPDQSSQLLMGNFQNVAWESLKTGNYILIGEGVHFTNVPFAKNADDDYIIAAEVFNTDTTHFVRINISSVADTVNNGMVYVKSGLLSNWSTMATNANVLQMVSEAIDNTEWQPHSHKRSVSNIAELQRFGANVTGTLGIPDNEKVNGYIVKVLHYDENDINSSTAEAKIIMFDNDNVQAYWNDVTKWRWIDDESGSEIVLTPSGGNLTIDLKEDRVMSAALSSAATIVLTNASANVGKTRIVDITGSEYMDTSNLKVINGEVVEDKIQLTLFVRSASEVRCWIENIPA